MLTFTEGEEEVEKIKDRIQKKNRQKNNGNERKDSKK